MGDVLEHMPKSQGVDFINFMVYRCKTMLIVYPIGRIQNEYKDSQYEAHISVWGINDFDNFDYIIIEDPKSEFVVVEGFIPHKGTQYDLFTSKG